MPPGEISITDDPAAGLCAHCLYARRLATPRGSEFYLCERSATDPSFPKYPRLPILRCPGYEHSSQLRR